MLLNIKDIKSISISENKKFACDNLTITKNSVQISVEGYILNAKQLINEYKTNNICEVIYHIYEKQDIKELINTLKGAYIVCIHNFNDNTSVVFNDLLSKQELYYSNVENNILISSSFLKLTELLKANNVSLTPNEMAFYMMKNRGVLSFYYTYLNEIKFLQPFEYISISEGNIDIKKLDIPSENKEITIETAIENMDKLFSEGTKLQCEKNIELGYKQVTSLSGGMDSRQTLLYANKMGYAFDTAFTYAQSGSLDETTSQQIAKDFNINHFFHDLGYGNLLTLRDEIIKLNEGQMVYAGTTGLYNTVNFMNCKDFGIVHAGIGGGEIMGDINLPINSKEDNIKYIKNFVSSIGCPNKELNEKLENEILENFNDYNQFISLQDTRVCINFKRTAALYFDVESPFLYEDFFKFMLTVPYNLKAKRALYYKWVDAKVPNSYGNTIPYMPKLTGTELERKIRFYMFYRKQTAKKVTKYHMNHDAYWNYKNPNLSVYFKNTLNSDLNKITNKNKDLIDGIVAGFDNLTPFGKARILTCTWMLNQI